MEQNPAKENGGIRKETGWFEGKRYDVAKLYDFAANIPEEMAPLAEFQDAVLKGGHTWIISEDLEVPVADIVGNFNEARTKPELEPLIKSIETVDLEWPILVSYNGHVIDGLHRISRALIENRTEIKIKRLPFELPESALLLEDETNI